LEIGEALDHAEDVLVGEEVLAELLLRDDRHRPKAALAFVSIRAASSSASTPRTSASVASVWTTYAGSFVRPRSACGARYGLSVSARRRSAGTAFAASRSSGAFGYVTFPANETYQPRSSAAGSSAGEEKQCRTTVPSKRRSVARVSSSAAGVWITTGLLSSEASASCSSKSRCCASCGA